MRGRNGRADISLCRGKNPDFRGGAVYDVGESGGVRMADQDEGERRAVVAEALRILRDVVPDVPADHGDELISRRREGGHSGKPPKSKRAAR